MIWGKEESGKPAMKMFSTEEEQRLRAEEAERRMRYSSSEPEPVRSTAQRRPPKAVRVTIEYDDGETRTLFGDEADRWLTVASDLSLATPGVPLRTSAWAKNKKPPVFIAVKGHDGAVAGHIRADRIEAVVAIYEDVDPMSSSKAMTSKSKILTLSGITVNTWEPHDQVFAKMADALNIEAPP